MARTVLQRVPHPPDHYDQTYIAQLAQAVNSYMVQREAPGETTAARFICLDPPIIPDQDPSTAGLPTGTMYLKPLPGSPGVYFLTLVRESDPQ